jgi:hypothetical protein
MAHYDPDNGGQSDYRHAARDRNNNGEDSRHVSRGIVVVWPLTGVTWRMKKIN